MTRPIISVGVLLLFTTLAAAAPAMPGEDDNARKDPKSELIRKLKGTISFGGFEKDDRMTLRDGLDQMAELYDLTIDVNEAAFRRENVADVLNTLLVDRSPIPKMRGVTLDVAIRKLLSRVLSASGATYVVRKDHIEITTVQALSKEVRGHNNGPLPPLVNADFDRSLLGEALRSLAEDTGFNILLDPRAAEKFKTPVTARLDNVPVDTAVRLLGDMAGLKPVRMDNVLYITTAENAKALQEEQEKRTLERSGTEKPAEATFIGPPPPLLP